MVVLYLKKLHASVVEEVTTAPNQILVLGKDKR